MMEGNPAILIRKHELYATEDVVVEIGLLQGLLQKGTRPNGYNPRPRLDELLFLLEIRAGAADGPCDDVTHWF